MYTHGVYIHVRHWPFQVFSLYEHFPKLNLHKVGYCTYMHVGGFFFFFFGQHILCIQQSSVFFLYIYIKIT